MKIFGCRVCRARNRGLKIDNNFIARSGEPRIQTHYNVTSCNYGGRTKMDMTKIEDPKNLIKDLMHLLLSEFSGIQTKIVVTAVDVEDSPTQLNTGLKNQ